MTAAPSIAGPAAFELAFRATLLLGAAWAAAAILRKVRASAAARHMAWLLGIAALLALPLLWWLAPPLRLAVLRPEEATMVATALTPPTGAVPTAAFGAPTGESIFLAVYLTGVAALLLRFVLSRRLVSRLWRDAEPQKEPAWQNLLSHAGRELRLSRPVALRIARGSAMPMTWGTMRPKILLPAEAHAWPPDRRRLVLLHELAHVARRDSLSRSAAALVCALYWFHPGAWFAARQMRLEQECAADDRVLTTGAPARNYAHNLVELALRVGGKSWSDHAAAMAAMCQLERRLVSITTTGHRERPGHAFVSVAVLLGTCVMLAVSTGVPVRPLPDAADPLGIETRLPGIRVAPTPPDDLFGRDEQIPDRATSAPPRENRSGDSRDGVEAPRTPLPPTGQIQETAGQPIAPTHDRSVTLPADAVIRNSPDLSPRLAVYGPQLPQPLAEEQASDPRRIPAALRPDSTERSVPTTYAHPRRDGLWRFLPRFGREPSGFRPQ